MTDLAERRDRIDAARLYLICDATAAARVLEPALRGGVDVFQLRDKELSDAALEAAARDLVPLCRRHGALLVVNDRPAVAAAAGADGVHVGQDDMTVFEARELAGPDLIVGRSTHTSAQVDAAGNADYIGVGPVHATPTKPGRPAAGLDLIRHAATSARVPFFAIGGIDAGNARDVVAAGARRIAVVRAIVAATDPELAAHTLCAMVARVEAGVGNA